MAYKIGSTTVIDDSRNICNAGNVTALCANVTSNFRIPVGTSAQRPASPATGTLRYNTDTSLAEVYTGSAWVQAGGVAADYTHAGMMTLGSGCGTLTTAYYMPGDCSFTTVPPVLYGGDGSRVITSLTCNACCGPQCNGIQIITQDKDNNYYVTVICNSTSGNLQTYCYGDYTTTSGYAPALVSCGLYYSAYPCMTSNISCAAGGRSVFCWRTATCCCLNKWGTALTIPLWESLLSGNRSPIAASSCRIIAGKSIQCGGHNVSYQFQLVCDTYSGIQYNCLRQNSVYIKHNYNPSCLVPQAGWSDCYQVSLVCTNLCTCTSNSLGSDFGFDPVNCNLIGHFSNRGCNCNVYLQMMKICVDTCTTGTSSYVNLGYNLDGVAGSCGVTERFSNIGFLGNYTLIIPCVQGSNMKCGGCSFVYLPRTCAFPVCFGTLYAAACNTCCTVWSPHQIVWSFYDKCEFVHMFSFGVCTCNRASCCNYFYHWIINSNLAVCKVFATCNLSTMENCCSGAFSFPGSYNPYTHEFTLAKGIHCDYNNGYTTCQNSKANYYTYTANPVLDNNSCMDSIGHWRDVTTTTCICLCLSNAATNGCNIFCNCCYEAVFTGSCISKWNVKHCAGAGNYVGTSSAAALLQFHCQC